MNVMQEINILKLHAAFPQLDVDTVNDVLNECGGNTAQAEAKLQTVFGSGGTVTPVQSLTRECGTPWSPVPEQRLANCANKDATVGNAMLDSEKNVLALSVGGCAAPSSGLKNRSPSRVAPLPTRIVPPEQKGKWSPTKPSTPSNGSLTPSILDCLMPPAPQPAPSPTPSRAFKPPLPQPVPLGPEPPHPEPAAAKKTSSVPLHLQHLLNPPPPAASPTPQPTTFEPGGWEDPQTPRTAVQPPQSKTASPAAAPNADTPHEESKLEFLQGMFAGMDAALVADVLQGVDGNAEAAIEKLMALQDVVDHTQMLDSSSGSDKSSISQSQMAIRLDSASANGGEPWDVSGVPVDYTFQDLSDEQKVVLIRRELPGCRPEEAMNALEVCGGNVNDAVAVMSQAYDKKVPSTPEAGASAEVLELKEMFPDVDPATLGNVYNAAGKDVKVTKKMLAESGVVPFEAPAAAKKAASALFSQPAAAEVCAPTQQPLVRTNGRHVRRTDVDNQRLYEKHRAEADAYREEMRFKYAEAQRASERGDPILAMQLRDRGYQAREKYRAADRLASKKILKEKNKLIRNTQTVDLHGQHVDQAVRTTDQFVRALQALPTATRLELITGRGAHSQGNIARLLPAVEEYLKRKMIPYSIHEGGGSIVVEIIPSDNEPPDVDTFHRDNVYEPG